MSYYEGLSREAERRRRRAEWRAQRLGLGGKREALLQEEGERWEREWRESGEGQESLKERNSSPDARTQVEADHSPPHSPFHPPFTHETQPPTPPLPPSPPPSSPPPSSPPLHVPVDHTPPEASQPPPPLTTGQEAPTVRQPLTAESQTTPSTTPHAVGEGRAPAKIPTTGQPPPSVTLGAHSQPPRGHAPPSLIKDVLYESDGEAPEGGVVRRTTRGHAPPSTIQDILYATDTLPPPRQLSTRGHAPPSKIQHLLYHQWSPDPSLPHPSPPHPPFLTNGGKLVVEDSSLPPSQPYILDYPELGKLFTSHSLTPSPPHLTPSHPHLHTSLPHTLTLSSQIAIDKAPQGDLLTSVLGSSPLHHGTEPAHLLIPLPTLLDYSLSLPLLTQ